MTKEMLKEVKEKLMNRFLVSNHMISEEMANLYKRRIDKLRAKLSRLEGLSQEDFQEFFYRQKEEDLNAKIKKCDRIIGQFRECANLLKLKKDEFGGDMSIPVLDTISYYFELMNCEKDKKDSFMSEYQDIRTTMLEEDIASIKREIAYYEDIVLHHEKDKPTIKKASERIDSILASVTTED